MDRKTSIIILLLFYMGIYFQPTAISGMSYWEVNPNWKFIPNNSGPILFNSTAYFNEMYFQGGYVYFGNVFFSEDYSWGDLGFNCSTNANVTLVRLDRKQIQYIVNAPTSNVSTVKIKLPMDREPATITGATNYTYDNMILTVSVNHSSPSIIDIEWNTFFQVLVKALTSENPIENATVLLSNPSMGTITSAHYTNEDGYTPQEDIDIGNYSLNVYKEDYQPYTLLFEFNDTTILEIPLRTIEEGILLNFNIELLIFTIMACVLSVYGWQRRDIDGLIAATIGFFVWVASGLWFMWTYVATEQVHFWYLFEMFAIVTLFIAVRNMLYIMGNAGKKSAWDDIY